MKIMNHTISVAGTIIILIVFGFFLSHIITIKNYQTAPTKLQANGWEELKIDEKFAIQFPAKPSHERRQLSTTNLYNDLYDVEVDGMFFNLTTLHYSDDYDTTNKEANKKALQAEVNDLVASTSGNTLTTSTMRVIDGNVFLDYFIQNKNESASIKGTYLIANKTFYKLMVVYPNNKYNEVNYSKFINSFQVKK